MSERTRSFSAAKVGRLAACTAVALTLATCSSGHEARAPIRIDKLTPTTGPTGTTTTTLNCANPGDAFAFTPGSVAAQECPQDFAPSTTAAPPPVPVAFVPSVVDDPISEALSLIQQAGLSPYVVNCATYGHGEDPVVQYQDPPAGPIFAPETMVTIDCS
jgi:hypothetical protein